MRLPESSRRAACLTTLLALVLSACSTNDLRGGDVPTDPRTDHAPDPYADQQWRDAQARALQRQRTAVAAKPAVKPKH